MLRLYDRKKYLTQIFNKYRSKVWLILIHGVSYGKLFGQLLHICYVLLSIANFSTNDCSSKNSCLK